MNNMEVKEGTRRTLEYMPFDKMFNVDGNEELCHSTGEEVYLNGEWWNEYVSTDGGTHYGR